MSDRDQTARERAMQRQAGATEDGAQRIKVANDAAIDWRIRCPSCKTVRVGALSECNNPCPRCGYRPAQEPAP